MVMIRAMEGLAVAERWWWQEKTHTPLAIQATEGLLTVMIRGHRSPVMCLNLVEAQLDLGQGLLT